MEPIKECQREIRRLRSIVRQYNGVTILDAKLDLSVSGRSIGDAMEEAFYIASEIGAERLSFDFNSYKITIDKRKEEVK
jgi:hypothetical protein